MGVLKRIYVNTKYLYLLHVTGHSSGCVAAEMRFGVHLRHLLSWITAMHPAGSFSA
jgi:hypothetical protein